MSNVECVIPWGTEPKPGMVGHTCNPRIQRLRKQECELRAKASLDHSVGLSPKKVNIQKGRKEEKREEEKTGGEKKVL